MKVLSITKGKTGFDLWRGSEEYQGWLPLHQVSDWLRWELQHAIENPHATPATWHPWYSQGW